MIVGQTVSAVGELTDRQTDLRIYYIDSFVSITVGEREKKNESPQDLFAI